MNFIWRILVVGVVEGSAVVVRVGGFLRGIYVPDPAMLAVWRSLRIDGSSDMGVEARKGDFMWDRREGGFVDSLGGRLERSVAVDIENVANGGLSEAKV